MLNETINDKLHNLAGSLIVNCFSNAGHDYLDETAEVKLGINYSTLGHLRARNSLFKLLQNCDQDLLKRRVRFFAIELAKRG